MKAKHTNKRNAFTLIELTVVILVLLSLIAVLFIGANAWKKGSDRATSILNQRNAQTAGRSWQNINNRTTDDDWTEDDIVGPGNFMEATPNAPGQGESYEWQEGKVPSFGKSADDYDVLFMITSFQGEDEDLDHRPEDVSGW
jgi:prepilin-type N-terminal cleavage/methylation domain-containing protein